LGGNPKFFGGVFWEKTSPFEKKNFWGVFGGNTQKLILGFPREKPFLVQNIPGFCVKKKFPRLYKVFLWAKKI